MEWEGARSGGTAREPCADSRKLAAGPVSAILLSELHFDERDTASRVVRLVFVCCQIAAPQRAAAQCQKQPVVWSASRISSASWSARPPSEYVGPLFAQFHCA